VTAPKWHLDVLSKTQREILEASAAPTLRWDAYLAGGTAVAIHLGHRRSDDFDWFTKRTIRPAEVLDDVRPLGRVVVVDQNEEGTFLGRVDGVKFSAFRYRYQLLEEPSTVKRCQLASLSDIAAMKLLAITQRATKRDYVDIHAMLTTGKMSLGSMIRGFARKFPTGDPSAVVRALGFFGDVDKGPMPEMLNGTTWETVKRDLARHLARLDLDQALRRGRRDFEPER
jgi:hypothetical protein